MTTSKYIRIIEPGPAYPRQEFVWLPVRSDAQGNFLRERECGDEAGVQPGNPSWWRSLLRLEQNGSLYGRSSSSSSAVGHERLRELFLGDRTIPSRDARPSVIATKCSVMRSKAANQSLWTRRAAVVGRVVAAWASGLAPFWLRWRTVTAVVAAPVVTILAHAILEELSCRGPSRRLLSLGIVWVLTSSRLAAVLPASDTAALLIVVAVAIGIFVLWLLVVNAEGGGAAAATSSAAAVLVAVARFGPRLACLVGLASFASIVASGPAVKGLVRALRGPDWIESGTWARAEADLALAFPEDLGAAKIPEAADVGADPARDVLLPSDPLRRPSIIAQYRPPKRRYWRSYNSR